MNCPWRRGLTFWSRAKPSPKTQVVIESVPELKNHTDKSFYNHDNTFPDLYRLEWEREFDVTSRTATCQFRDARPDARSYGQLRLRAAGSKHSGAGTGRQRYGVALLLDKVVHSPDASSTLVFVIEDDAQDGGDDVDAHRSTAYIVGPYVKHHAVISEHYATVNMAGTIEDILGTAHQNLHDGGVPPMTDVFDITQQDWTFHATPSAYLLATQLPISQPAAAAALRRSRGIIPNPTDDAAWWEAKTKGTDFSMLTTSTSWHSTGWYGGGSREIHPYPTIRSGADLRHNRAPLLQTLEPKAAANSQNQQ